jgi:hypothetical protein
VPAFSTLSSWISPHPNCKASENPVIRLKIKFLEVWMGSIVLQSKKGSIVLQIGEIMVLQRVELE